MNESTVKSASLSVFWDIKKRYRTFPKLFHRLRASLSLESVGGRLIMKRSRSRIKNIAARTELAMGNDPPSWTAYAMSCYASPGVVAGEASTEILRGEVGN